MTAVTERRATIGWLPSKRAPVSSFRCHRIGSALAVAAGYTRWYDNPLPTAGHNPKKSFRASAISLARRLMNAS